MSRKATGDEQLTDWSIQEIAALSGTTSRTLRHYDTIGLLPPSRIASNGYRHYDHAALVRLQRILLLRELGLSLPSIASVLAQESSAPQALRRHVRWLRDEQDRLGRLITSVEKTIAADLQGATIMAKDMLDGFDHTEHKEEVQRRWGKEAYTRSDEWWTQQTPAEKDDWKARLALLNEDWLAAFSAGTEPTSPVAQDLARRHVQWLRSVPGTPSATASSAADVREYVLGLAQMYVADPRFAVNYGGTEGAAFVRDALVEFIDARQPD